MKLITRIITVISLASALIATPIVVISSRKDRDVSDTQYGASTGIYEVSKGDVTLKADRSDLTFEINKNGKTFYSSKLADDDTSISSAKNKAYLTSPVTVGYFYNENSIAKRSLLDPTKKSKTSNGFIENEDGFSADIALSDINISFRLTVSITSVGINISIPYSSIVEKLEKSTDNRISYLNLYPAFSSSHGLIDNGYIFIPDGSGALVDLGKNTSAHRPYSKRVYDADIGISDSRRSTTSTSMLSLPMTAISSGETTVIEALRSGDEYATLESYCKGVSNDYNYTYFNYTYRDNYQKYVSADESKRVGASQEKINEFDISQDYLLSDYLTPSKMATTYKSYLEEQNALPDSSDKKGGLYTQFLMSDSKQAMMGRVLVKMSDTDFIFDSVSEMNEHSKDMSVSYLGYSEGGYTDSYPDHLPTENATGGDQGYRKLNDKLSEKGISSFFDVNYSQCFKGDAVSDSELAKNISGKYIASPSKKANSEVTFYSLTGDAINKEIEDEKKGFSSLGASGLSFSTLGSSLYSTYTSKTVSRKENKVKNIDTISKLGLKANMESPNYYMYKYLNAYLEAPLSNSGFLIETSSFPLLSIIFSGHCALYSPFINLNYYGEKQILRLIDYNISPSFLLTEEDPINLFMTNSEYIFTSSYSVWKDTVREASDKWQTALKGVRGEELISHEEPQSGISINTYGNGNKVIINYTENDFVYSELTVKAMTAQGVSL